MQIGKIATRLIAYGFYAVFFATPLIFNPLRSFPSYELFEWNKMILVYLLTALIVAAWLVRMVVEHRFIIKRTPFDLPLALFTGSQVLATIFSIDPHVSFFGYYSRFHGGLLSTITYILLFYSFVSNYELINMGQLLRYTFSGAGIVAIYGILEKFGIDAQMWVQDVRARVFSTLGQPNWLAAYLAVLLPISIQQFISFSSDRSESRSFLKKGLLQRISSFPVFWLLTIIFYICILLTKSRSGFLGFWVANALLTTILLVKLKTQFKKLIPFFLILNCSFLILNFFIRTPFSQYNTVASINLFTKQAPVEEAAIPAGSSVIDVGITDSAEIRKIVWEGAGKIIQAYPLFGTGPETFAYAYYRYRPVAHNLTSEWEFLYNRAHNEFLNIAATSGLVGLTSYLFFIAIVCFWSARAILRKNNPLFLAALLASFIGIAVTNFFGFSVVVIGLFFFMLPAWMFVGCNEKMTVSASNKIATSIFQKVLLLTIVITLGSVITLFARWWLTDSLYAYSYSLKRQGEAALAYEYIEKATAARPDEPVYHDERATIASSLVTLNLEKSDATAAARFAKDALTESELALMISPQNVNFWKTRTRVLYELSVLDQSFLEEALAAIEIARQLAPTDPKIIYNAGVIYGELGKNEEAINSFTHAIEIKPDYRDVYIALAIFYEKSGQIDKARETLELALSRVSPDDQEIKERIEKL
ncbi:TPA: hypothetical protein DIV55_02050 [Patescibacteria group bacterium]|nr:hypothetical protein [Patescibacteria group bacterium]